MRIPLSLSLAALFLLAGASACARPATTPPAPQEAAYARTPGETLRYRKHSEWTVSDGLAGMPRSESRYRRDSRFAITFTGDGLARAWFESVRLESSGGSEPRTVQVAGDGVAGLPFVLSVGPRGSDSVVSTPGFPSDWRGLESQFNGFFPRLPGGPLTPGRAWTDSGTDEGGDTAFVTRSSRYIAYRVTSTERIRGADVVVVRYDGTFESEERWRKQPTGIGLDPYLMPAVVSHTQTEVHGTIYFAPRPGRIIRHTWTSETFFSRPSGHVESADQQTNARVTVELISSPRG
ncbi:MAG TPA: hypothetical protein VFJ16_14720 [Longimicrobium sp.]|nr:hypothetical protein [Longimicrobium sp.]